MRGRHSWQAVPASAQSLLTCRLLEQRDLPVAGPAADPRRWQRRERAGLSAGPGRQRAGARAGQGDRLLGGRQLFRCQAQRLHVQRLACARGPGPGTACAGHSRSLQVPRPGADVMPGSAAQTGFLWGCSLQSLGASRSGSQPLMEHLRAKWVGACCQLRAISQTAVL